MSMIPTDYMCQLKPAPSPGQPIASADLAAAIAACYGTIWLRGATPKQLRDATDAACKTLGIVKDTRQAIMCLKAIRAYVHNVHR